MQADIQNGEVAELGSLYQINGLAGPCSTDPGLSFFPNPNALAANVPDQFQQLDV